MNLFAFVVALALLVVPGSWAQGLPPATAPGGPAPAMPPRPLANYGTVPKEKASDYPANAQVDGTACGAEYLVHSFFGGGGAYDADKYLVIEVALYPPKGGKAPVSSEQFSLRINGAKRALSADLPGIVANSLGYAPSPDAPRGLEASGGIGGINVGTRTPSGPRFPNDPTPEPGSRHPQPPQVPEDNPAGIQPEPPPRPEQIVLQASLPNGEFSWPVSGYLFFAYKRNTKSIHSLDLLWKNGDKIETLHLF